MSKIILAEQASAPDTPGSGKVAVYVDTNGDLAWKDDAGNINTIASAGGYTLTLTGSGTPAYVNATTTWTPALLFGGAATGITYGTQVGRCVRIGNIVAIYIGIVLTSKGSATGNATISGLPFTPGYVAMLACRWNNMTSSLVNVSGYVQTDSTVAVLGIAAAATNLNSITDAAFANNSVLIMTGIYLV